MMNRILIPLDGSEFSAQVLPAVRRLFDPAACELVLYRVGPKVQGLVGMPPRPASSEIPLPMYGTDRDLEQARHPIYSSQETDSEVAALTDGLEPVAQALRDAGYKVRAEAALGAAGDAIVERAQADDIDLIAMTTHGRSGLSRLIFGSVAGQVLHQTRRPVLLLRPSSGPEDEYVPHA